jgi:hypothetical protein
MLKTNNYLNISGKCVIMKPPRFCEKSIFWVLSYRDAPRKQLHKLYRYGVVDDHTDETWKWTLKEASNIQKHGLEHWLLHTDGPYGYQASLRKALSEVEPNK